MACRLFESVRSSVATATCARTGRAKKDPRNRCCLELQGSAGSAGRLDLELRVAWPLNTPTTRFSEHHDGMRCGGACAFRSSRTHSRSPNELASHGPHSDSCAGRAVELHSQGHLPALEARAAPALLLAPREEVTRGGARFASLVLWCVECALTTLQALSSSDMERPERMRQSVGVASRDKDAWT